MQCRYADDGEEEFSVAFVAPVEATAARQSGHGPRPLDPYEARVVGARRNCTLNALQFFEIQRSGPLEELPNAVMNG